MLVDAVKFLRTYARQRASMTASATEMSRKSSTLSQDSRGIEMSGEYVGKFILVRLFRRSKPM